MIGFTKLLTGKATVSKAIYGSKELYMLQFSTQNNPVVVWNITNRCNLNCLHCYISADNRDYDDELNTHEAKRLIDDLASIEIPVLLFSGGEPLLREDIFELGRYAKEKGLRIVLSSNGTLITKELAFRIKEVGFQYVGISLDGRRDTHDKFRGIPGAFDKALVGLRILNQEGVKTGIRFTINKYNHKELPDLLELVEEENIPRFCMYHLVYAGRGKMMVNQDSDNIDRLEYMEFLCKKTLELHQKGVETEILTTDNHADAVLILKYIAENLPEKKEEIRRLLNLHGGCSAGVKIANIDPKGDVYPCQFFRNRSLGNTKERRFSQIWNSFDNELLAKLRNKGEYLKGKCGRCSYKDICGGCRIRAFFVYGDIFAEDPACYLEI
jgi:radical SAM protein with 4Fe4S-binding SPASM domain